VPHVIVVAEIVLQSLYIAVLSLFNSMITLLLYKCFLSYIEVTCPLPPTPPTVTMLTKDDKLHPGKMIQYKCKDDFILLTGSLRRTCLLSGTLTGTMPACISKYLEKTSYCLVR